MTRPVPVVVAMSGGGRTVANLIEAAQRDKLAYEVVGIISSGGGRSRASALAAHYGLPLFERAFPREPSQALADELQAWLVDRRAAWLALAGFLRKFPHVAPWSASQKIVNIHPALLPAFGGPGMYGDHVHQAVWQAGHRQSGASVHFVTEHYDEGALIAQVQVVLQEGDSPQSIAAKVFKAECHLYPMVLDRLIRGELPLPNGEIFRYEYRDQMSP